MDSRNCEQRKKGQDAEQFLSLSMTAGRLNAWLVWAFRLNHIAAIWGRYSEAAMRGNIESFAAFSN